MPQNDRNFAARLRIPGQMSVRLKRAVRENVDRIYQEIRETRELYDLMLKWSREGELSPEEKETVKAQLIDICKTVPALAVFMVPFGGILLAVLIKYLPFNILPSAFEKSSGKPPNS